MASKIRNSTWSKQGRMVSGIRIVDYRSVKSEVDIILVAGHELKLEVEKMAVVEVIDVFEL